LKRHSTGDDDQQREEKHNESLLERELDDAMNHRATFALIALARLLPICVFNLVMNSGAETEAAFLMF
jgi:hypothetical protein